MLSTLALALALVGCDPFMDVQDADTIEAYEGYLAEHPDNANAFKARIRLEELYLAKAEASEDPADWDLYLDKFPDGTHHDKAVRLREEHLFAWATAEGTEAAWATFVEAYPKAKQGRNKKARDALAAMTYLPKLAFAEPVIAKTNLAEDPDGPLDGWKMDVDVTNNGDKTVATLWFRVHYLGADGTSLGSREWPIVAPYANWPVPIEEERTVPMKPGETRTWTWSTGDLPDGWANKIRLEPFRIRFDGDAEE